jgi:hypothetical protein
MFSELMNRISKYFSEPINGPLRKKSEMVKAEIKAQLLEAEEAYETSRISSLKNPRGSVRLVPRYYPDEKNVLAHGQSHVGHGPLWDSQTSDVTNHPAKKLNRKKPLQP